jgi:translation initiation factor 1
MHDHIIAGSKAYKTGKEEDRYRLHDKKAFGVWQLKIGNYFRYLCCKKYSLSMDNDWKKRLGMVYSTNPDFDFNTGEEEEMETLEPRQQQLYVSLDKKNRKGKKVTLIEGFQGSAEDLKGLAKELKSSCGVGGSVGESGILIQGDFRDRVIALLQEKGFQVKRKGG